MRLQSKIYEIFEKYLQSKSLQSAMLVERTKEEQYLDQPLPSLWDDLWWRGRSFSHRLIAPLG